MPVAGPASPEASARAPDQQFDRLGPGTPRSHPHPHRTRSPPCRSSWCSSASCSRSAWSPR